METELSARTAHVIHELRNIQDELSKPVADQTTGMAIPRLPLQATQELKATVDGLRLFLWAYLDTWSGELSVEHKLQQIRIEAAADMLRLLDQDFRGRGVPPTPQAQRLCRQIVAMSDLAAVVAGRQ